MPVKFDRFPLNHISYEIIHIVVVFILMTKFVLMKSALNSCAAIKLNLWTSGGKSPRHAQNPLLGE